MKAWIAVLGALSVLAVATTWCAIDGYTDAAEPVEDQPAAVIDVTPVGASSMIIGIGPGLKSLPSGTYQFITVYADGKTPKTVTYTVGGESPVPPDPPDPPEPDDVRTKIRVALQAVNSPQKSAMAKLLAKSLASVIKQVDDGKITTSDMIAKTASGWIMLSTVQEPAIWVDFATSVNDALGTCPSPQACKAVLEVIVEELEAVQ